MLGHDVMIIPVEDIEKLLKYLTKYDLCLSKEEYKRMGTYGVLGIFSEIKDSIKDYDSYKYMIEEDEE